MRISVVIPTFNRREMLAECLGSLFRQQGREIIPEIVVCDDGSLDGTCEMVAGLSGCAPVRVIYLRSENRGPASARNLGVRMATGDAVLFMGDDGVAAADLLAAHRRAHGEGGACSVLGHVTWHPELPVTPFMRFQENGGSQFAYWRIADPENAGFLYYYTTNVSTPRSLLLEHPFDEGFPHAAFEDLELGYRLEAVGHRIRYVPAARAWHNHPTTPAQGLLRNRLLGREAVRFAGRHPADERLAALLSVTLARRARGVNAEALAAAEETIARLEALPFDLGTPDEREFGQIGAQGILFAAYRLLMGNAYLSGIREALGVAEAAGEAA